MSPGASVGNLTLRDPLCGCTGVVKLIRARPNRPLPPWQAIGARNLFLPRSDSGAPEAGQIQRLPSHIRADHSA